MDSTVRMGTALAIPAVLRRLGANPEALLAELGYDLKLFDDAEKRIGLAAHNRIFQHCATRTACPHFGLLVGQQEGLHSLGLMGLLVKYSPDVGTALRNLLHHLHLHVRGASIDLEQDGNSAMLTWHIHQPGIEAIDHVGDGAIAVIHNVMREICGDDWSPSEAWFARRRLADVGPFRQFFGVPSRFDAEQFALVFPARFLTRRLPIIDDQWHRLLQKQIDSIEDRSRDDFPKQVRGALRTALLSGQTKADQVAALFGMHSRTMNRHLRPFRIGFQQLIDEARFEFARQMLQDTSMEVGEISELLGYAAPGVFTRAFQRWSGATPAAWRARTLRRQLQADQAYQLDPDQGK